METTSSGQEQKYYVDENPYTTAKPELTVRRILEKADRWIEGADCLLVEIKKDGNRVEHQNPEDVVRIRAEKKFFTSNEGSQKGSATGGGRLEPQGKAPSMPSSTTPGRPESERPPGTSPGGPPPAPEPGRRR